LLESAIIKRDEDNYNREKNNLVLLEQKKTLEIKYNDMDKIIK
jgi:hypothetical protein